MHSIKDGGAVVEFTFNSRAEDKKRIAYDIVEKVSENLKNHRASFNMQPIRTFLVKGEPFYEDMVARYPSPRLRIEFQGEPVTVERLYKHLRKYGRIYDIAIYPNPFTSKDPPRYAIAQFTRIRSATSARNCLHGHYIRGQRINILYERQLVGRIWIKLQCILITCIAHQCSQRLDHGTSTYHCASWSSFVSRFDLLGV